MHKGFPMGDAQSLEHGFLLAFVFADDGEIKLAAGLPVSYSLSIPPGAP